MGRAPLGDGLFNRAVALAALKDAEGSRQFVQGQLELSQEQQKGLQASLQTATTRIAVLETRLSALRSVRWVQQLVFGIGAAIVGAGLGTALSTEFRTLHWVAMALGAALMIIGAVKLLDAE